MLKNIDFHILTYPSIEACGIYICRLIEKIYANNNQVYLYTENPETSKFFDHLLWTFHDGFIPHLIHEEQKQLRSPVIIGYSNPLESSNDILINTTSAIPKFYLGFEQVFEIVPEEENLKNCSRKKYKAYQQDGYQINLIKP